MLLSPRARRFLPILVVVAAAIAPDLLIGGPVDAALIEPITGWVRAHLGQVAGLATRGLLLGAAGLYFATLVAAMFVLPLGVMARAFALRRFRARGTDAFERARARFEVQPGIGRRLGAGAGVAVAALAAAVVNGSFGGWSAPPAATGLAAALMLGGAGVASLFVAYLRRVMAPFDAAERGEPRTDADGTYFSAVAVTREARAVVAAFTAVTMVTIAFAALAPTGSGMRAPMLAYLVAAPFVALAFSRLSRIALGVDGVLVMGTSKTRFIAYRDLDDAAISTFGDLVLKKAGKVVLRLQIHGDDAPRTNAILERVREAIARAAAAADDGAQRLAERSPAMLAQAARGDGNYRAAGATREALWEILESGASDGKARAAAARALAAIPRRDETARLRIAAESCVDPAAREELRAIAEEQELMEARAGAREAALPRSPRPDAAPAAQ